MPWELQIMHAKAIFSKVKGLSLQDNYTAIKVCSLHKPQICPIIPVFLLYPSRAYSWHIGVIT